MWYIDIDRSVFIEETLALSQIFQGAFSYKDLLELNFDDYECVIKRFKEVRNG